MKTDFNSKTVLLTGASGGIGSAIASILHNKGANLILVGRNKTALEALGQKLGGNTPVVVAVDLSTSEGRQELLSRCQRLENGVDLLINNAGINEFGVFEKQSQADITKLLEINLLSPILLCHDLLPLLQSRPGAHIVNIGSTFGAIGYPGFSTYCASKFGLRGFTEALRRELAGSSTQVSYIAPRATTTAINTSEVVEMNKALGTAMDDPREVALEVVNILEGSSRSDRYIGWPEKFFVRLNALLPKLVDNSLRKNLDVIRRYARG